MNALPLVSVVVLNYNYKRYLNLRIQSILQQTYQNMLVYFIIVIFNNNRKYMYFDLNRIIYFNIFFMVNLLKVKTIRNFINVVKIGIVLFKYWADRSNLFVYRIPVY